MLDVDKTLSDGYSAMAFLDYLNERRIISPNFYKEQIIIEKKYYRGEIDYDQWCADFGLSWEKGFKGYSVKDIGNAAKDFFQDFKKNIYPTSYQLVDLLKEYDYHTIIVSTSAFEVISLIGKELGVDEVFASKMLTNKGVYAGKMLTDFHLPGGKKRFIDKNLVGKYNFKDSLAAGDSSHDVEMLEMSDYPIALNPKKQLQEIAEKRGWYVFNYENVVEGVRKILN